MAGVHGLAGELLFRSHHDQSDVLADVERVQLTSEAGLRRVFGIRGRRSTAKGMIVQLDGVNDRDAASRWKRATVSVGPDALAPLDDGEFYLEDVRGFDAVDAQGALLGRITGFVWTNIDIATIRTTSGREWLFPLLPDRVLGVDYDSRQIRLDSEGLEDLAG